MYRSHRAKMGLTKQMRDRLRILKDILNERKKTLVKMKKYQKYGLRGYNSMIRNEQAGIEKTKIDIQDLKKLITERYELGQIYKVRF